MVTLYKPRARTSLQGKVLELQITENDYEGNGVGRYQQKIVFVSGALAGEQVQVQITEDKADYLKASVRKVLTAAATRVKPACKHFGQCGGCQLQYLEPVQQQQLKQQGIDKLIRHTTGLAALPWQPMLSASPEGYRRKARIGVWYDKKSRRFTVGFRQAAAKTLTDIEQCLVLSPVIAPVFGILKSVLPAISQPTAVTHVEAIDADGRAFLIVRHVQMLTVAEKQAFISAWPEAVWIGESAPGQFDYWQETTVALSYQLTTQQLTLAFSPDDFIQVNAAVNQLMVNQALDWLAPQPDQHILDLYCGMGNFSLALSQRAAKVVALEGMAKMVQQANINAALNRQSNVEFAQADLHLPWPDAAWHKPEYQKIVLDPARAGAQGAVGQLLKLKAAQILYVSCNAATFARDAKVILAAGYQLHKISGIDMFPQTSHLELMALFNREGAADPGNMIGSR
ncbi:23S rRNA (uracil(1939)-C(5))-methyltransferase RlmD [Chromatiaceae bacterium AAb-1]|nr:23S rRNA (uracil(1939)-C(5))-methyltransferase RlmD [Chromatiaceae bacterium AAb-1]